MCADEQLFDIEIERCACGGELGTLNSPAASRTPVSTPRATACESASLVGLTPILAESPTRATRPLPTLATRATNGGSAQVNRRESGLERLLAISGYSRTRHASYIDECWLWGSLKLACPV